MTRALARLWRWPLFLTAVIVALGCVLFFEQQAIDLPGADGPRFARQFVVAWMPVFGATLLIDPIPEVTATLPRTARVYLLLRCAMFIGALLPLVTAWVGATPVILSLYDALIVGVLLAVANVAVSKWQATGLLSSSLVSVIWLLGGDSLATALRFADITGQPLRAGPYHWALGAFGLCLALVTVARGAGSTRLKM